MPQSLAAVYLHVVFSTKNRHPFLTDPNLRRETHMYLAEIAKRLDCPAIQVGGTDDHVHALVRFGREITIAEFVKELKRVSSVFIGSSQPEFGWQAGYGAFSVDPLRMESCRAYVRGQEEHHRKVSFEDELRQLLRAGGLKWDERYLWD